MALLAALLLPALARARYSASNAVCRSNLRQIQVAISLYTGTHRVFPLYAADPAFYFAGWWNSLELPRFYQEYTWLKDPPYQSRYLGGIFQCPLNPGAIITMHFGPGSGRPDGSTEQVRMPSITSYGYNAWGILGGPSIEYPGGLGLGGRGSGTSRFSADSVPESAVRAPSDMIATGDEFVRSKNPALDAALSRDTIIAPGTRFASVAVYDSKTAPKRQPAFLRHRGKANRAFVDGHVEGEDMRKTFAATDEQIRRWNTDNEPHRKHLRD